jgi:hypothetical protein
LFVPDFAQNLGATHGAGFHPLVNFDSPEAEIPEIVLNSNGILRDAGSTVAPNNVGPIGGRFAVPVNGIAFDLSSVEGTAQTVRLFGADQNLIGEATTPIGNTFFGIISPMPFTSFVIQNGMFATGIGNDRYFLDNFRANAIPEPSTFVLLLLVSVIIGTRRW